MWRDKKVSVVFPTYREKKSIRSAIEDFLATGYVDEVVVVNNNAEDGTDEEVRKTPARLIYEKRQGLGYAFQTGMKEATGDLIVLSEPDGTFVGSDLERFLVFAKDFLVVFGSRTNQSSLYEGSTMGSFRKWANALEGKLIEVLFATSSLTDVGCNYKLFHKSVIGQLEPLWHRGGRCFPRNFSCW